MGRGTRTASLEVKLIQQVTAVKEEVLHTILLDLHKAYEALDRSRCWRDMAWNPGSPASHRYWERLYMVVRAGGYYGEPLSGERGINQGDPL